MADPRPWMSELAMPVFSTLTEASFKAVLASRDLSSLPDGIPRWHFLQFLTQTGWLLHGSARPDIQHFIPRTPTDLSPDEFSRQTAVFAASDALWAMMYALTDRNRVKRMLNLAFQVEHTGGWLPMAHFLSFAPHEPGPLTGRELLTSGSVYVLPRAGFSQMRPYSWPGLGTVLEPHWANPASVTPHLRVPVTPQDFPLPVRLHDSEQVDALSQSDPWDFPWLLPQN